MSQDVVDDGAPYLAEGHVVVPDVHGDHYHDGHEDEAQNDEDDLPQDAVPVVRLHPLEFSFVHGRPTVSLEPEVFHRNEVFPVLVGALLHSEDLAHVGCEYLVGPVLGLSALSEDAGVERGRSVDRPEEHGQVPADDVDLAVVVRPAVGERLGASLDGIARGRLALEPAEVGTGLDDDDRLHRIVVQPFAEILVLLTGTASLEVVSVHGELGPAGKDGAGVVGRPGADIVVGGDLPVLLGVGA